MVQLSSRTFQESLNFSLNFSLRDTMVIAVEQAAI